MIYLVPWWYMLWYMFIRIRIYIHLTIYLVPAPICSTIYTQYDSHTVRHIYICIHTIYIHIHLYMYMYIHRCEVQRIYGYTYIIWYAVRYTHSKTHVRCSISQTRCLHTQKVLYHMTCFKDTHSTSHDMFQGHTQYSKTHVKDTHSETHVKDTHSKTHVV